MKNLKYNLPILFLVVCLLALGGCQSGCQKPSSVLSLEETSKTRLDTIFTNTPVGNRVREHVKAMMGHGENAETNYQQSLSALKAEPGAAEVLYTAYRKVPPQNFFLRTMLTEGLKELRSPIALVYLSNIAKEKIPADLYPQNAEINTKENEVVIRITAVEGISLLAADRSADAEKILIELIDHEDLTVRQMAVRGYLNSAFGNANEKMAELRRKLPKEEHWYITSETTDIKKVAHPQMPAEFKLKSNNSTNAPKIKQK